MAGTFYLKRMGERFGYPGMLAAYNAGPRRYQQYLESSVRRNPSDFSRMRASAWDSADSLYPREK